MLRLYKLPIDAGRRYLQGIFLRDGVLQVIYEKENNVPATGDTFRSLTALILPITALMTMQLCRQKKRSRCVYQP